MAFGARQGRRGHGEIVPWTAAMIPGRRRAPPGRLATDPVMVRLDRINPEGVFSTFSSTNLSTARPRGAAAAWLIEPVDAGHVAYPFD